ncbi:MAG TPA: VOC family protein [Solirubrobacteraceae bacterium]|nr:VOC family protein [Solirubrobacteraceae bacterium]
MIQHVTREVPPRRLDACVTFYRLLGFNRVTEPAGLAGTVVWVERHGTQIHLQPRDDARAQSGHVGVIVDPYDNVVERLRAAGHQVDPRAEHWGSPRAFVRDPAGNLVEIIAWAPGGDPVSRP